MWYLLLLIVVLGLAVASLSAYYLIVRMFRHFDDALFEFDDDDEHIIG